MLRTARATRVERDASYVRGRSRNGCLVAAVPPSTKLSISDERLSASSTRTCCCTRSRSIRFRGALRGCRRDRDRARFQSTPGTRRQEKRGQREAEEAGDGRAVANARVLNRIDAEEMRRGLRSSSSTTAVCTIGMLARASDRWRRITTGVRTRTRLAASPASRPPSASLVTATLVTLNAPHRESGRLIEWRRSPLQSRPRSAGSGSCLGPRAEIRGRCTVSFCHMAEAHGNRTMRRGSENQNADDALQTSRVVSPCAHPVGARSDPPDPAARGKTLAKDFGSDPGSIFLTL
jgi:hypothetical protein